jgi:predicted transcriptional regulator of viral defense system
MVDLACFNTGQVYAWRPDFDRNNFVRWTKKRLLIRLRQGYFTFPEFIGKPNFAFYFANRIYRPSCISLHTALSFYGLIPESVVQITSVSPLKTASFANAVGEFTYKSIKQELMFGYELKPLPDGRTLMIASPEKALLDLLYLYPQYNTTKDLLDLRLDEDYLHADLKIEVLQDYLTAFKSKVLNKRIHLLLTAYGI